MIDVYRFSSFNFTLCMQENFACFLLSADFFVKINIFEKFFQEIPCYLGSVKVFAKVMALADRVNFFVKKRR